MIKGYTQKWNKVFKNVPSEIFERQPLENFIGPFLNTSFQIYSNSSPNTQLCVQMFEVDDMVKNV